MWAWHVKMATQTCWSCFSRLESNSLTFLQIWELTFGPKAKLLFRLWAQGWSRFWSWSSGKILKLEFVHHFAADVLCRLWSCILVEILKLCLVNILNIKSRPLKQSSHDHGVCPNDNCITCANLNQILESRLDINFNISTKHEGTVQRSG